MSEPLPKPSLGRSEAKGPHPTAVLLLIGRNPGEPSERVEELESRLGGVVDFSRATLTDRWAAGSRDMAEAVRLAETVPQRSGIVVHRISADRNDHL
jgi:hypothetical protein